MNSSLIAVGNDCWDLLAEWLLILLLPCRSQYLLVDLQFLILFSVIIDEEYALVVQIQMLSLCMWYRMMVTIIFIIAFIYRNGSSWTVTIVIVEECLFSLNCVNNTFMYSEVFLSLLSNKISN